VRARRDVLAPQPGGDPLRRDGTPGLEGEEHEQGTLLGRAEPERLSVDAHLDRP
jgi:hypothetical protein